MGAYAIARVHQLGRMLHHAQRPCIEHLHVAASREALGKSRMHARALVRQQDITDAEDDQP